MTTVLLFVEHELSTPEVAATLGALAALRADGERPVGVTVLVPYRTHWQVRLMDDVVTARGSSAAPAFADTRHEAALVRLAAQQILRHVLSSVRAHGHVAEGELVPMREAVHDLASEAAARQATTALIVCQPHRLAHLLHRDLAQRLRRAGVQRVVHVNGARVTDTATVPPAR